MCLHAGYPILRKCNAARDRTSGSPTGYERVVETVFTRGRWVALAGSLERKERPYADGIRKSGREEANRTREEESLRAQENSVPRAPIRWWGSANFEN